MANLAPIVLLSGVAGRLVDSVDNRRLIIGSALFQAAACLALAFVDTTGAVLALVAALGVGQAVTGSAWQALLPSLVPPAALARAVSLTQSANMFGGVAAPALSGVLSGWYGARVPLLVDAGSFLVVLVAAVVLRTRRAVPSREGGVPLRGGVAIVRRSPVLLATFALVGLFVLLGSMVNVVEVFLVRSTLGAGPVWYGVAAAGYSLGLIAGALAAGRLRTAAAQARWLIVSAAALSIGLAVIGLSPDVLFLTVVGFGAGAANGVFSVCTSTLVLASTAPDERGRVSALLSGVVSGLQLGAYLASAGLAAVLTPREIFVAAGLLGVLAPLPAAGPLLRAVRRVDGEAATAPAAQAAAATMSTGQNALL
jgi:MFS family permease